jgi:aspartate/methionine/tyrosine aminotransferase
MQRKGFTELRQLMEEALTRTNVSFCTRDHFGRAVEGEKNYYIRFAYSGIEVEEIEAGMVELKNYFEA